MRWAGEFARDKLSFKGDNNEILCKISNQAMATDTVYDDDNGKRAKSGSLLKAGILGHLLSQHDDSDGSSSTIHQEVQGSFMDSYDDSRSDSRKTARVARRYMSFACAILSW